MFLLNHSRRCVLADVGGHRYSGAAPAQCAESHKKLSYFHKHGTLNKSTRPNKCRKYLVSMHRTDFLQYIVVVGWNEGTIFIVQLGKVYILVARSPEKIFGKNLNNQSKPWMFMVPTSNGILNEILLPVIFNLQICWSFALCFFLRLSLSALKICLVVIFT